MRLLYLFIVQLYTDEPPPPVFQLIFPNLCDHASYTHSIVGTLNPTDSLMKKCSLVPYYYLRPSSESKECRKPFLSRCVSIFSISIQTHHISLFVEQVSAFIHHLRRIYRYENSYHNFEHALDVLQAAQSYLKSEGMVPSPTILFEPTRMWKPKKEFDSGSLISTLGLRELFILYVAAIGHDVGHPGFTNGFMVCRLSLDRIPSSHPRFTYPPEKCTDTLIRRFRSSISFREHALPAAASGNEVPWFWYITGRPYLWSLP